MAGPFGQVVVLIAAVAYGSVCGLFGPGTTTGTLGPGDLDELSGLAASRAYPGVFWGHDDSGGKPELFALTESGADLGRYAVDGAKAIDWEDIAEGPGNQLYIGDIGDNTGTRDHVVVYRVAEPAAAPDGGDGTLEGTETFTLRYPTVPVDAESLLVDPVTGDVFIVTKSSSDAHVYSAPAAALVDGADITLTDVGTIPAALATAADVSPDGRIVLVRTYGSVLAFERPAGGSLADAFAQAPCDAPQVVESQGESIAFTAAGDAYLTAGEGVHQPIHKFAMTQASTTTTTTVVAPDNDSGGSSLSRAAAVAIGAFVVVGAALAWVTRRRGAGRRWWADRGR